MRQLLWHLLCSCSSRVCTGCAALALLPLLAALLHKPVVGHMCHWFFPCLYMTQELHQRLEAAMWLMPIIQAVPELPCVQCHPNNLGPYSPSRQSMCCCCCAAAQWTLRAPIPAVLWMTDSSSSSSSDSNSSSESKSEAGSVFQ
jgi:hypothetical protein